VRGVLHAYDVVYAALASLTAFLVVVAAEPAWIRVARARGLVGRDMNKPDHPTVAEAGGVWAVVGLAFGLLVLEALYRYLRGTLYYPAELFALVVLLLLSALLGFTDDILGWKKGLPAWQRVAFMAPISLPLVVIKAGKSTMELPLLGVVNFGLAYPLVLVPIGVLGAANAFNMIAGLNGLEAGMAVVLFSYTAVYAAIKGVTLAAQAAIVAVAASLGLLVYNWYPARVFPGNAYTYATGAYYAAVVIIGNMEKFGVLMFTPYFIELILFIRGLRHGVYKENFGKPLPDGRLAPPYSKTYSVTHAVMKLYWRTRGGADEKTIVATILALEAALGAALILAALRGIL